MTTAPSPLDRLASHQLLASAPHEQLVWIAEHGELLQLTKGDVLSHRGQPVRGLFIVLAGHLVLQVDRGAGAQKTMDWRAGEVTGVLPYSRLVAPPGDVVAEEPSDVFLVPRDQIPTLIHACNDVTAILVHAMIDRDRRFSASVLHEDKVASLGKLAAGLAHELNNPASAVASSAKRLSLELSALDRSAQVLGGLQMSTGQHDAVERVRSLALSSSKPLARSAMEQLDRDDAVADWLGRHGIEAPLGDALARCDLPLDVLDELARALQAPQLEAAMQWLNAACAAQQLTNEIETAAARIHDLVAAVKGFTYMDHAPARSAVDIGKCLEETITVLNAKAREKGIRVSLNVDAVLPPVEALGGELNQVWANLLDNALDAAVHQVQLTATRAADGVAVGVVDDGVGVPSELRERIFDPFFTTKPMGQGMGLGLDIARRIVRRHGGTIDLDSHAGRTEFRVTLPANIPHAAPTG